MVSPEFDRQPRLEERVLTKLGYGEDQLDRTISMRGRSAQGRNFLDIYSNPEKRQDTEDMLYGFDATVPGTPEYDAAKEAVMPWISAVFGPSDPN